MSRPDTQQGKGRGLGTQKVSSLKGYPFKSGSLSAAVASGMHYCIEVFNSYSLILDK